ncbi:N-acetyltransferase GCN5 [Caballeronia glebae]|uniref:N-acetyltransferase GCN5 n=1 Tax=Caballeronia glebae TaxID=1777143 RepID=A0A158DWK7_9BURK|nr:N-acetyltransferase GCN5 [Caballeronia glebae]
MLNEWLIAQGLKRVDTTVKMVRNAPADAYSGPPDSVFHPYGLISQAIF